MTDGIGVLVGMTLASVDRVADYDVGYGTNEALVFTSECGRKFVMTHFQDCCESVTVEEIIGDLDDVIGSPIVLAEEESSHSDDEDRSRTWTFYTLRTAKGTVTIRWYGHSNGYYSEAVSFFEVH